MSRRTAEDHFTTGLLAGVIFGLLFGYIWKALETRIEGVSHGAAAEQLVDCVERGGPSVGVHLVRTDTRGMQK